ncbi:MAG TPA: hypothetical protein VIO11_06740 [Candidatus Methanoperedens sp.]
MVRLRNTLLIAAIGLLVLFSGCAGTEKTPQEKVLETPTPFPTEQPTANPSPPAPTPAASTPAVQGPPFHVQVTEARILDDCIVAYGSKQSCFLINLDIQNNNDQSVDFKIVSDSLVSKVDKDLGARYDTQVGLSDSCIRPSGLAFKLNARSSQTIGMCYPPVSKSEGPNLKIAAVVNNERKDFRFDVSK